MNARAPRSLFWLSFCDPDRPEGSQFLGACIVEGEDIVEAASEAHRRGCNPGGEVMGASLDVSVEARWMNRLLTLDECKAFDAAMEAN